MSEHILSVKNLSVDYEKGTHFTNAVNCVSFSLNKGECLALVGESGCGKSTIALTLMGLLPARESRITSGEIFFKNENIFYFSKEEWRQMRGKQVAMIFQDPFSSLNPVMRIGEQLDEALELDSTYPQKIQALSLLSKVQLSDPERIYGSYPHQLSGGQRQRVMIAMALSRKPDLLIADEPTTALDVTVQDEIMKLLKILQNESHMAMIFVTHNLGLVKNIADNVAVMRHGEIVEQGTVQQVLFHPTHPYSKGLIRCMPQLKPVEGRLPTLEDLK